LARENYELDRAVGGVDVYFDGIRYAWRVHGLWMWLTTASHKPARALPVDDLVRTSVATRLDR
ncbi:MAG: hypothetical protein M3273_07155, partial [Actinomycetota bacterium]|nr:hypothetical protein [Actinomycetota bacterium]